jgi:predicted AAA+ superfamily ATPase
MTLTRFRLHLSCIPATIDIPLSLPKAAYLPGPNAKAWSRSLRELHSDLDELVFRLGRPDDDTVLEAVRNDPSGFVRSLDTAIVDEVQRAPDLLRATKKSVDTDSRPGRFLLTGSANVLTLPQVSESLAGRMETRHTRN